MTTSLDSIPLKTSKNNDMTLDDSDDPMVKDILNEFQQELEINTQKPPSLNEKQNYNINYNSQKEDKIDNRNYCNNGNCNIPTKNNINNKNSYYNEIYIKKTLIIIVIVFLIFSPIFIPAIFEKLPLSFIPIIQNYDLYIKILILFISIYILFFYNLI